MGSPRVGVVFRLWQCDKDNHGWREGPPRPSLPSFDLLTGPSPSGKVSFERKKNTAFRWRTRALPQNIGRYKRTWGQDASAKLISPTGSSEARNRLEL
jgi:hypothetical protein